MTFEFIEDGHPVRFHTEVGGEETEMVFEPVDEPKELMGIEGEE